MIEKGAATRKSLGIPNIPVIPFHFGKSEIFCRTHGNNNNGYKRKSEKKNPKLSWFLGPKKFSTSQKPSQTYITLIWAA